MRGIDLFCGCGGLTQGLQGAGISVVAAYDNWAGALQCYRSNFGHPAKMADLTDTAPVAKEIAGFRPDIIVGGPPCQDFSSAGRREEKERANLTVCFAEIITAVRPKWFLMENVDRAQKSAAYGVARKIFVKAGYGLTEDVLNACFYGVPQNRRRFFCIGLLGAGDGFLSDDIQMEHQEEPMTIRQYFKSVGEKIDIKNYYRHPRSYKRRAVFSIDEPSPTIRGVNRPVPNGYRGHNGDKAAAPKTRPLTTRERALIQTLPKDFQLPSSKTAAEQLLGNAVPVGLARAVASAIFAYEQMTQPQTRGRKVKQGNIAGIDRLIFIRWLTKQRGLGEKSAKDIWSWLSRAGKYVELGGNYADEYEMMYCFDRATAKGAEQGAKPRMKRALRYFQEFCRHNKNLKTSYLWG